MAQSVGETAMQLERCDVKAYLGDLARAAALTVTSPKMALAALGEYHENKYWYSVILRANVAFFLIQIALRCWVGNPSPLIVALWIVAAPVVVLMPVVVAMLAYERPTKRA